jgi:hypothetical protein
VSVPTVTILEFEVMVLLSEAIDVVTTVTPVGGMILAVEEFVVLVLDVRAVDVGRVWSPVVEPWPVFTEGVSVVTYTQVVGPPDCSVVVVVPIFPSAAVVVITYSQAPT